ncbi:MAG: choice-of-anchor P family protein [Verrucomicrobiota bacterium]
MMKNRCHCCRAAAWLLAGLAGWLLVTGGGVQAKPAQRQAGETGGGTAGASASFRGEAAVVFGSVLGLPLSVSDTGPLPGSGGAREASLLNADVPGLLSLKVCHAATVGQGDVTFSEASVANVGLNVGGNVVGADFVMSWAMTSCCTNLPELSGRSIIAGLVVNGQAIEASGQPNQTIALPNGRIVINEQVTLLTETSADITVNALHIVVNGVADIVISSAYAGITCGGGEGQPPQPCGDFVTGGGWITDTPSGAKANFGVAGGIRNGALWGHLNYIDHGNGMHVKHTSVIGYAMDPDDADCRIIDYTVTINGMPGTARVRVCDKGEPGRNDIFEIALSNGYSAGGDLGGARPGGGNIQLHVCR